MSADIASFSGPHRFLSNFTASPVLFEGYVYPSVEHAYQAAKTHPSQRAPFREGTAAQAKQRGRTVQMRDDWERVKHDVMLHLLREKFGRGTLMGSALLKTGDAKLIEGNHWGDTHWGVCRGVGENHLGRLLMQVRAELQRVTQ